MPPVPGDASRQPVSRLGLRPEQIVIEYGYDEDVDEDFREAVEAAVAGPLEDEDYDGVVDVVLLWWRDGDGDLVDDLVDCSATLEDGGHILLLTPAAGRPDRVAAADVEEACTTTGLTASGVSTVGPEWVGQRLVRRRGA